MRQRVFLLVLILQVFLLYACANTYQSNKEAPEAIITGEIASAAMDVLVQETANTNVQSVIVEDAIDPTETGLAENETLQSAAPTIMESDIKVQESITKTDVSVTSAQTEGETAMDNSSKQEPVIESPQSSTGEQPPLMTRLLQEAALSFEDFEFSQFVLVATAGSEANIYCYDKGDNGFWEFNKDLGVISGYVGRNGISAAKSEGDDYTPAGLFRLGYAFGNSAKPSTGMTFKAITKDSYWVDDPNSVFYNQWVEGMRDADWSSAEHLADNVRSYAYAIVVEYNTAPNIVAGKGSAIFIHCGDKPTSGCITVSEDALLRLLKWLSEDRNPSILVVSQ